MLSFVFFFFKQKTAYEMRISDWSSDVCSSDLFHGCVLLDQRVLVDHQARLEGGDLVGGIEVLGRKPIDFLGDETVDRVAVVFETLVKPLGDAKGRRDRNVLGSRAGAGGVAAVGQRHAFVDGGGQALQGAGDRKEGGEGKRVSVS